MIKKILILSIALIAFFLGACSEDISGTSSIIYTVNSQSCIGCNKCYEVCPFSAISMVDNKAIIDPSKCTGCGKCVEVCPVDAIY